MKTVRTKISGSTCRHLAAFVVALALTFGSARDAFAQACEMPGSTAITATTVIIPSQTATIGGMVLALTNLYNGGTVAAGTTLIAALEGMETIVNQRMRRFWRDWEEALKAMTTQLNAGASDQARQMSNLFDSSNLTDTARAFQLAAIDSHANFRPTDAGCRFDTTATYMATAGRTTAAISTGLSQDLSELGNAKPGTPAVNGPGAVTRSRFETYRNRFCDHLANGGGTACGGTSATSPNAHIMPSVTLFGRETIDMANEDTRIAVNELVYNITGFVPPEPIDPSVLASPTGREGRLNNRAYLAQMDAVNALAFSIVGERAPGQATPEVQQMRQRMGIGDASPNASEREIRQSIIEQLWDPAYYVNLTDGSTSVAQKEVFLQAYNLMLLYRMYEKTERIANAHAIETANLLEKKSRPLREGGTRYVPVGN
jgi:hypothetical protein